MVRKVKTPATKTKVSKSKRSKSVPEKVNEVVEVVATPVTTPVPVTVSTVVTETVVETLPYQAILDQMHQNMATLTALNGQFGQLKKSYVTLEKSVVRELKAAYKTANKKKRKAGNRAPSGFVKPTLISNELAAFLDKPSGTEMARTEVTREINAYIRKHSLQDPANGRKINPDTHLRKLLKLGADDELTYFNLQKYMSPHFQKASQKLALEVAAAAAAALASGVASATASTAVGCAH